MAEGSNTITDDVSVCDPKLEGTNWGTKYVTYSVSVNANTDGKIFAKGVRRRYKDFLWLRTSLAKTFPGLMIPPLPGKRIFNKDEKFDEERQLGLKRFLCMLLRYSYFEESDALKAFLTKDGSEDEKKRVEKKLESRSFNDALTDYGVICTKALSKELPKDPVEQILILQDFLNDSKKQLQDILSASNQIRSSLELISENFKSFCSALESRQKLEDGLLGKVAPEEKIEMLRGLNSLAIDAAESPVVWDNHFNDAIATEIIYIDAVKETISHWILQNKELNKCAEKLKKYSDRTTKKEQEKMEADMKKERQQREFVVCLTRIMMHHNLPLLFQINTTRFKRSLESFIKKQRHFREQDQSTLQGLVEVAIGVLNLECMHVYVSTDTFTRVMKH